MSLCDPKPCDINIYKETLNKHGREDGTEKLHSSFHKSVNVSLNLAIQEVKTEIKPHSLKPSREGRDRRIPGIQKLTRQTKLTYSMFFEKACLKI